MASKLVHVQTTVTSVFGRLDDDNNVVDKKPISLEIPSLKAEYFTQVVEQLAKIRNGETE